MGQSRPSSRGREAPAASAIVVYGRGEESGSVVAAFVTRVGTEHGIDRFRAAALPGYPDRECFIDAGGSYFAINGVEQPFQSFEIVALPRDDEAYVHIWRRFLDAATPTGRDLLRGVLREPRFPLSSLGRLVRLERDPHSVRYVLKCFAIVFDRKVERDHGERKAGLYLWGANGDGTRKFVVVPQYDRNEQVHPLFLRHVEGPDVVDRFVSG